MIFKVSVLVYTLSNEIRVTRTSKFLAHKTFPSKLCHKKKDDNGALVVIVLIFLQDKKKFYHKLPTQHRHTVFISLWEFPLCPITTIIEIMSVTTKDLRLIYTVQACSWKCL